MGGGFVAGSALPGCLGTPSSSLAAVMWTVAPGCGPIPGYLGAARRLSQNLNEELNAPLSQECHSEWSEAE